MIDKLKLLSGEDIKIDGIATFKQPKLRDIYNIGMDVYYTHMTYLIMSAEQYLISTNKQELIPHFKANNLTMFDIYEQNQQEQYWFIQALSFFIEGEITYNKCFLINNDYPVDKNTYQGILEIIGEISCFKVNSKDEVYSSDKARQIAEKISQAKAKRNNTGNKEESLLDCIISSVAGRHPSLNLLNIWDLSAYQLYDQYQRLFALDSFKIQAMNYAYYGGDFKASWSKPLN